MTDKIYHLDDPELWRIVREAMDRPIPLDEKKRRLQVAREECARLGMTDAEFEQSYARFIQEIRAEESA